MLSLFVANIILYIENNKEYTKYQVNLVKLQDTKST
jgi:hypothetical protein